MRLMQIGLVFWFVETAFFGFNRHPSCYNEQICDAMASTMIIVGWLISCTRNRDVKQ